MGGRMERIRREVGSGRAVSPVVGVMLMLVVAVVLAAVVNSFAGGLAGTQEKAPQASFAAEIRSTETTGGWPEFVMKHLGGDPVDTDSVKLVTKWYNETTDKWEIQETTAVPLSDSEVIYYDKWDGRYENFTGGTDDAINVLVDLSDVGTCNIAEVRLWLLDSGGSVVASHTETNPDPSFWWNTTVTADDTYNVTVNYTADEGTGVDWTYRGPKGSGIPVLTADNNETRVYLSLTARCTKYADVNTEYNDFNSATTLYHVPYLVVPGDMPADASGEETEIWFGNYVIRKGDVIKASLNLQNTPDAWGYQNIRTPIIVNATYLKPGDVVTVELIDLTTNNKIFSKEVVVQ